MRKVSLLFFLLVIGSISMAQSNSVSMRDSLADFTKGIFLIDNIKKSDNMVINNARIFEKQVLALQINSKSDIAANKEYSIKLVQNKLCAISYDYRKYLYRNKQKEQNHSTFSSYNIDGKIYPDGFGDTVYALLTLNPKNVRNIQVKEDLAGNYSFTFSYQIYITTKN